MFCPKCGSEITQGYSFCLNCGAAVDGNSVQYVAEPAAEPVPEPAAEPAPAPVFTPAPAQPAYTAPQYAPPVQPAPQYAPQYAAPQYAAPVQAAPVKQGMELRLQYVLTIMAASLLLSFLGTVAQFVFASMGAAALASYSITNNVIHYFTTIIALVCFIIVMTSAYQRRKRGESGVAPAASFVAMILWALSAIALFCFPRFFAGLLNSPDETMAYAVRGLRSFAVAAFVSGAILSGLCFLIKRRLRSNLIICGAAAVLSVIILFVTVSLLHTGIIGAMIPIAIMNSVYVIVPNVGKWYKNV